MGAWRNCKAQPLTSLSLDDLFSNGIPAIRIPDYATPAECRAFAEGLRRCKLRVVKGATDHSAPSFEAQKIAFIGLTQFEFKYKPIEDYLDAAEVPGGEGGHTTLHNSPWTWQRNREGKIAENYPLPCSAVESAQSLRFRPEEGEVVLFNSQNPHEVFPVAEPNGKDRIAMATFIGRKPNGDLHLWS